MQRLRPPHWQVHPPGAVFGRLYERSPIAGIEAARFHGQAIAAELRAAGISVDCLPLLDVPAAGSHDIIGDRAFADDALTVASLGDAVLRGLREAASAASSSTSLAMDGRRRTATTPCRSSAPRARNSPAISIRSAVWRPPPWR